MSCKPGSATAVCRQNASSGVPSPSAAISPGLEGFAAYLQSCHDIDDAVARLASDLEQPAQYLLGVLASADDLSELGHDAESYAEWLESSRQEFLVEVCKVLCIGNARPREAADAAQEACADAVYQIERRDTPADIANRILESLYFCSCPEVGELVSEDGWGGLPTEEIQRRDLESRLKRGVKVDLALLARYPDLIVQYGTGTF